MTKDVYSSSLKFLVPLTPEETYKTIVDEAIRLVDGKYGSIFIPVNSRMQRVYASFPKLYEIIPRQDGITHSVYTSSKPSIRSIGDLMPLHPKLKEMKISSDICVPLTYNNMTVGVLSVLSTNGKHFDSKDLEVLRLFIPLATMAIKKAILYDQLYSSLEAKDVFVSIASHELKTPLTSILIYTQILAKYISKAKVPPMEYIDKLLAEEVRLKKLVNELLQINQIKTGALLFVMQKCDLKEILEHAVANFRYLFPQHKIEFRNGIKEKPYIIGDRDRLLQAAINLLNNAGKYSNPGSTINVSLAFKSPYFVLEFKDNGKGIRKKSLPYIFEKFYKGSDSAKGGGIGLGLYLVRYIIAQHHGTITVNSKFRKGTTVTVTLPQETKYVAKNTSPTLIIKAKQKQCFFNE